MTGCSGLLSSIVDDDRSQWTCRQVSPDTLLVVTPHHYADGDTVELMVQTIGDEVIVSDGGEVLARLDSVGVNVDPRSRVGQSWKRLLAAHAVDDDRGQLVRRAGIKYAADLVREMADAVANLDGLRLLAPAPRRLAFPERLTTYLEAEFPFVEPRAKLRGLSSSVYQVTAVGNSEEQPIYVQTASGRNTAVQKSAAEHCFTTFSDVNGQLPAERKLVVLDDEASPMWRPELIKLLSRVAYVGTWIARDQWTEFVRGKAPKSRLMLPPERQTIS